MQLIKYIPTARAVRTKKCKKVKKAGNEIYDSQIIRKKKQNLYAALIIIIYKREISLIKPLK